MVAFNFMPQFAGDVEAGRKLQTIRQKKKCKPGDKIQLYTGQRTKACRKLGDAICTDVDYVSLYPDYISFGNAGRHPSADEFARADGFKNYPDMFAWFQKQYGQLRFTGYVHKWELVKNA